MSHLKAGLITVLAAAIIAGCGYSTDATYDQPDYPAEDSSTVAGRYPATVPAVTRPGGAAPRYDLRYPGLGARRP